MASNANIDKSAKSHRLKFCNMEIEDYHVYFLCNVTMIISLYLIRCKYKKLCSNYSFSNYLESIKIKVLRLTLMRFTIHNKLLKKGKMQTILFLCKHVQNLHLFKNVFLKYPIYGIQRD